MEKEKGGEIKGVETGFVPSRDGFNFINSFEIGGEKGIVYGLCGGMCLVALDMKKGGKEINGLAYPDSNSGLYRYLLERQIQSLGSGGVYVFRFVEGMIKSDSSLKWENIKELEKLYKKLLDGEATPVGLIYVRFPETVEVWKNHQVLAVGYRQGINGEMFVHVYDPNQPGNDDVWLNFSEDGQIRQETKKGEQWWGMPVRGMFVMPHKERRVPRGVVSEI